MNDRTPSTVLLNLPDGANPIVLGDALDDRLRHADEVHGSIVRGTCHVQRHPESHLLTLTMDGYVLQERVKKILAEFGVTLGAPAPTVSYRVDLPADLDEDCRDDYYRDLTYGMEFDPLFVAATETLNDGEWVFTLPTTFEAEFLAHLNHQNRDLIHYTPVRLHG